MATPHDKERKKSELVGSLPAVQLSMHHSPRVERQFSNNITLVPHQQAMLQRCLEIERLSPLNEDYGRIGFMTDRPSSGKCLGFNTPILMHDGSIKPVQDVQVGDQLMGDDSTPRNVLSLARGLDDMYDVIPCKGDKYTVNSEHVLCLKMSHVCLEHSKNRPKKPWKFRSFKDGRFNVRSFSSKVEAEQELVAYQKQDQIIEVPVRTYLGFSPGLKSMLKGYRVGVEFPFREPDFDPYIIGLWLGDGSSDCAAITNQDSTILKYLSATLPAYDMYLSFQRSSKYTYQLCSTKRYNALCTVLRRHNLLHNKHIPTLYRVNCRSVRMQVLAGLIDSDGTYDKGGGFEIVQKSKAMTRDILYLARTLGLAAYSSDICSSTVKDGYFINNRIYISGPGCADIPTKVPRKKACSNKNIKNTLITGIHVKPVGYDNYYGFEIDGNHRFLLSNCTVTHNTFVTLAMITISKINGDTGPIPVNLIVVPPAILTQWKEAIEEYNGGNNLLQARMFTEYSDISALYFKKKVIRNYDVLVTTSMYYKVIVDIARDIGLRLRRMIIDEIDGAEWSISGKADAEMTWYISATFADACTSRGYIGQLMYNVPIVRLQERICMCQDEFVDASFALPDPIHSKVKCLNRHLDHLLTQFLRNSQHTLKSLNGGHYSAVKNQYHPVFAKNEQQVVDIIMFNATETVKRTQLHLDDIRRDPDLSQDEVMKLEKMISDAKLVEKELRRVIQDSNLCLLCYNFISGQQASTPCCCHSFCVECVKTHLRTFEQCPACKAPIALTDLWIEPSPYGDVDVGGLHTKLDAVKNIVKSTDGNKILIFSEFADCFDDLQNVLSHFGQILVMDSGTVEGINKTIKTYRTLDKAVLLVCSDHFGRGLNLENTSDIVFFHRMPETLTQQVVGRAQRVGRQGVLKIWHVRYENEYQ